MPNNILILLWTKPFWVNYLCGNKKEVWESHYAATGFYILLLLFVILSDVVVEEEREVREIRRGNQLIQSSSRILYRWNVKHVWSASNVILIADQNKLWTAFIEGCPQEFGGKLLLSLIRTFSNMLMLEYQIKADYHPWCYVTLIWYFYDFQYFMCIRFPSKSLHFHHFNNQLYFLSH